jgi:hypothetical protein
MILTKTPIKITMISGQPGARTDFVAGWLGTMPEFVDNFWYIDPETGQSNGKMRMTKQFKPGSDIDDVLSNHGYKLSQKSNLTFAGAWHPWHNAKIEKLDLYVNSGLINLFHIDVEPECVAKVFWENKVKTGLSSWTCRFGQLELPLQWGVDQIMLRDKIVAKIEDITDQQRIDFFEIQMRRNSVLKAAPSLYPHCVVSYKELFQPGGSYYLCNKLGITAGQRYHKYWDAMLSVADAPEEIIVWGRTWRQQDWPVDSYVMQPELHS